MLAGDVVDNTVFQFSNLDLFGLQPIYMLLHHEIAKLLNAWTFPRLLELNTLLVKGLSF